MMTATATFDDDQNDERHELTRRASSLLCVDFFFNAFALIAESRVQASSGISTEARVVSFNFLGCLFGDESTIEQGSKSFAIRRVAVPGDNFPFLVGFGGFGDGRFLVRRRFFRHGG